MTDMKTVRLTRRSKILHVEAPGCIINISPYLDDKEGRPVVHISIAADGDRYKGDPQWWVNGEAGAAGYALRIIQTNAPAAPAPVIPPELVAFLLPYITADDVGLPKAAFLRFLADRIHDDLLPLPCPAPPAKDYPAPITNDMEIIRFADIVARIAHLSKLRTPGPVDLGPVDNANDQDSLFAELASLEGLAEVPHIVAGFQQGIVFVRDDNWDFWDLPTAEEVAEVKRAECTMVDFDGVTYWVRG